MNVLKEVLSYGAKRITEEVLETIVKTSENGTNGARVIKKKIMKKMNEIDLNNKKNRRF